MFKSFAANSNQCATPIGLDEPEHRASLRQALQTIARVMRDIGTVSDYRLLEMSAVRWSALGMTDDEIALHIGFACASSTSDARTRARFRVWLIRRRGAMRLRATLRLEHPDVAGLLDELFEPCTSVGVTTRRSAERRWARALGDVDAVPKH